MQPHYCMSPTFDVTLSALTGEQQLKRRLCWRMVFAVKPIDQTKTQSSVEELGDVED